MTYPINKLNLNITNFLKKVVSADILGAVESGLRNQIELIDDGEHATDAASIGYNVLTGKSEVRLSTAYCQFFWLICDVALKVLDRNVIVENCVRTGITLEQFLSAAEQTRKMTADQVAPFLPPVMRSHADSYLAYLALVPELLKADFWSQMQQEYAAAMSIIDKEEPIHEKAIDALDINSLYSERVNSVYCYGIAFLLLHELAHHSLNHVNRETEAEDEMNADYSAFWSIYFDIDEIERFSANAGILCAFFSFLMYDPYQIMIEDHPTDFKRLFAVYDEIKDETPKYTQLLKGLLDFWATVNVIADYPMGLPEDNDSIQIIRQFFEEKYNNSNDRNT